MKNRILALFLCVSVLIGLVPIHFSLTAETAERATFTFNYGGYVGSTAEFDVYFPIPVSNAPATVENVWDIDGEQIRTGEVSDDLLLVITDYYISSSGHLWYKVKAAPGYTLPEKLVNNPWVYQDNINSPMGETLIIHGEARNFVFDAEGNPVSEAEIGYYETLNLSCSTTLIGKTTYQWQISVDGEWVDIMGRNAPEIPADYSLLANALDENRTALLRCVATCASKSVVGDPVAITLAADYDTGAEMSKSSLKAYEAPAVTPREAGDVCYVIIYYRFENGDQAANTFIAEVPLSQATVTAEFPYVQGYLPYYDGVQQDSLTITKIFTENVELEVLYKPTEVNYSVDIYFQNVGNDNYSFYDSRTYKGLTGSQVPLATDTITGMRELLHETPLIAADGSTHVEVYYDRIYYMTRVYLAGGYGIYSVYARYGADLESHLTAPSRPGYSFVGWDEYTVDSDDDGVPDSGGDGIANTVYPTVPAKNLAYVALWVENPTAQVNVVFWGENPNDEGYSYLSTKTLQVKPGSTLTYSLTNSNICGLSAHTHSNSCSVECGIEEHEEHTAACYKLVCDEEVHTHTDACCIHKHLWSCYSNSTGNLAEGQTGNAGTAFRNLVNRVSSPVNGTIYRTRRENNTTNYNFFYVNNTWYYLGTGGSYNGVSYNGNIGTPSYQTPATKAANLRRCTHNTHTAECLLGCGKKEHTHTDYTVTNGCYELDCTKTIHAHDASCYHNCIEHNHTEACKYPTFVDYDSDLWTLVKSDTVTVERDGSTVMNVYFDRNTFKLEFIASSATVYTLEEKWGAQISEHWPIRGTNGKVYNSGERWKPSGSSTYTQVLVYIAIMPQESFKLTLDTSNNDTYIMHYYGEVLAGETASNTRTYNGKTFKELFDPVKANYNYLTKAEDFLVLEGYDQFGSDPAFSGNQINTNGGDVYFYYTRTKSNVLEFHSGNAVVREEHPFYEKSLSEYAGYTDPPLPSNVEAGSHEFKGWYLNPECTESARVDLNTMTMPANNLALYAKWEPKYHQVRIVLQKNSDGVYGPEDSLLEVNGEKLEYISVLHGSIVFSGNENRVPPDPDNGNYKFLGWFYMDDGVELMWDFEHHPVVADSVIYAKWSSEVLVPYTVYYKDELGNDVAEPTTSSSLAGHSLTVDAKVGNSLKSEYREGYFPNVVSHSIELRTEDAENGVEYTFVYTKAQKKKYTVHYLDADNGNIEMTGSPVEKESSYAVVTETFKSFAGDKDYKDYVPDAYQKTLVLSANAEDNHIYFYYRESQQEGVWHVEYYVQNSVEPDSYDSVLSEGGIEDVNTDIEVDWPIDISADGFVFEKAIITSGSTTKTVTSWNEVRGKVSKEGLSIKVYYTRIKYPYKIVYINKDTGTKIHNDDKIFSDGAMYGSTVYVRNEDLITFEGYVYDSSTTCTIVKDNAAEISKNILYVYYTEQYIRLDFKVVGPDGCGTVNPGFTRVKYASDATASSTATPAAGYKFVGWYQDENCTRLYSTDSTIYLFKPDGGWEVATYYAKFEVDVAPMTIERQNGEDGQVYIYEISRNDDPSFVIYVTVTGNGSVTIPNMPITSYTVTQQNDWSWRYNDAAKADVELVAGGVKLIFDDDPSANKWLNHNSSSIVNVKGGAG